MQSKIKTLFLVLTSLATVLTLYAANQDPKSPQLPGTFDVRHWKPDHLGIIKPEPTENNIQDSMASEIPNRSR